MRHQRQLRLKDVAIKKALRSINFSNKEQITAIARTLSDEGLIDPIQKIVNHHGDAKGNQEAKP